jgi:hypothetical protein
LRVPLFSKNDYFFRLPASKCQRQVLPKRHDAELPRSDLAEFNLPLLAKQYSLLDVTIHGIRPQIPKSLKENPGGRNQELDVFTGS